MNATATETRTGELRYRALVEQAASISAPDHFASVRPTLPALRYRAAHRPGIEPRMDVYLPGANATGASVVLVHGGGFVVGSRGMKPMRFLASRLVNDGIAVASIDYRMIFRGGRLGEALSDVRTAFSFFRERARSFDLDPERVSLVGLSAGGTLAMLAASMEPEVSRLVCCFGLYELDHLRGPLASILPSLIFRTPSHDVWSARSPRGARQPEMPTLLLHGGDDGLVPVEQAERLASHRVALGLPTELVIYPLAPHAFFNRPCAAADLAADAIALHVR